MSDRALAEQIQSLSLELQALRVTVGGLERRLAAIEDFEVVQDTSVTASGSGSTSAAVPKAKAKASARAPVLSDSEAREEVLGRIGRWIASALAGNRSDYSGREDLPGPSRYYLVARSVGGQPYNPVVVCSPWAAAEPLVKDRWGFGESVFVGLPRWDDAAVVARFAGLDVSDGVRRGSA